MKIAIVASKLTKRFGAVRALDGMNLDVPQGACFGLVGENGAGKTTFIKILLGICRADDGSVQVLGGSPDDVRVRRRIGYLPERLSLPPAFTPVAFLKSVARLRGMHMPDMKDRIPRVLSMVGLQEEAWSRRTGGFSKGMKQRTGLAAALLGDPELLVLDEPTDGIDPLGRARVRDVILAQKQRGATVFLNSHLLAETERICDHVAVMSRGAVVVTGPLSTLKAKDAFRVRFRSFGTDGAPADAATRTDLARRAATHGFPADEVAALVDDEIACRFAGGDTGALSRALQAALADGLVVVEVAPMLRDLETILAEAVAKRSAA